MHKMVDYVFCKIIILKRLYNKRELVLKDYLILSDDTILENKSL